MPNFTFFFSSCDAEARGLFLLSDISQARGIAYALQNNSLRLVIIVLVFDKRAGVTGNGDDKAPQAPQM